jgi:hypothetical protein
VHLTGAVDFLLRLLRCEKSVVDHEVVHLWDLLGQSVVLSEESEELLARSVDRHLLGQEVLVLQHVFEENLAEATSLTRLVDVEVENAGCVDVTRLAELVEDVEGFAADFEESNHETTVEVGNGEEISWGLEGFLWIQPSYFLVSPLLTSSPLPKHVPTSCSNPFFIVLLDISIHRTQSNTEKNQK